MLQKLNERTQGVVAWFIIILIAATFALFGLDYYSQSKRSNTVKVQVNEQKITQRAFDLVYRRLKQQQDGDALTPYLEAQLKQQALKQIIVNTVSKQNALTDGFYVSAAQAKQAIQRIPQFQQQGQFSPALYQQILSSAYYTPDSFLQEVQQGMLLNQQRFSYVGTAFALPSEIDAYINLAYQTRDYDYLTIYAPDFYAVSKPSRDKMMQYYREHQRQFYFPEQVSLEYIELSMPELIKSIDISDDELKQYYRDNIDSYRRPARWKVAHILLAHPEKDSEQQSQELLQQARKIAAKLKQSPQLFTQYVNKYSADKLSVLNGGEMPWISATAEPDSMELSLRQLTKVGDISSAIKTRYGYEIVKVLDYKPSKLAPYNKVKEEIKHQFLVERSQQKYADLSDELADLSYRSPDSLNDVATQLNLTVKTTPLFDREGGTRGISANKSVIQSAFSEEVLSQGNNSDPIQINDNAVVVIRVKQHVPAKAKPFALVESTIQNFLLKQAAAQKAQKLGKKVLALKNTPEQLNDLLKSNRLEWKAVTHASRGNADLASGINQLAFSVTKKGQWKGQRLANGDYIVVKLKQIQPGDKSGVNKEQRAIIEQKLETTNGLMDYDLLIHTLMQRAKINKH